MGAGAATWTRVSFRKSLRIEQRLNDNTNGISETANGGGKPPFPTCDLYEILLPSRSKMGSQVGKGGLPPLLQSTHLLSFDLSSSTRIQNSPERKNADSKAATFIPVASGVFETFPKSRADP